MPVTVVRRGYLPVLDRLAPGTGASLSIGRTALDLVDSRQLDLFEFTNWEGLGIWFGLRRTIPFIVRLSTSSAETQQIDELQGTWQLRCDVKRELLQARLADALVTHSRAHRQTMADELGIDPARIAVVPLGVPVYREFTRPAGSDREQTVVFLGRMEKRKGTQVLLDAIPAVLSACPHVKFVLIGPDRPHCPNGRTHSQYLKDEFPNDVRRQVLVAGSLTDEQVTEHLQSADVFVAPSLYESFGLIFLEAMRWGTAVIGTTAGGIPEIVEDGESGVLVSPGNQKQLAAALVTLLKDPERRRRLGEAGRRRVEAQFSVEAMTANSLELYAETIRRGVSRATRR